MDDTIHDDGRCRLAGLDEMRSTETASRPGRLLGATGIKRYMVGLIFWIAQSVGCGHGNNNPLDCHILNNRGIHEN